MGLWAFIARRLVLAFFVLIIVSIATFLLTHAVPGDPITAIMSDRQANNPRKSAPRSSGAGGSTSRCRSSTCVYVAESAAR